MIAGEKHRFDEEPSILQSSNACDRPVGLAFIAGQLGLGGAEQQLYYLLSGLNRSRFRPIVISLGPMANEYWEQPITKLGIPVYHIPRHLGRPLRALRIADLLRVQNLQIVHGWVFHSNPYSALAGRLAKISIRLGSMREAYSGLPQGRFLRWLGYRGLDGLVTNSTRTSEQIEKLHLTRARVQTVPNGVSVPETINSIERSRLKLELGYSNTDLLIGSIGRIDENKNFSMLLRVFAPLTKKWPALRLIIIGDGPLKSQLAALAEGLGVASKVCFPGAIPQAARYLPAMEVCCLTSYTEGMPNFVMEAAAAGLPVVATRCGDSVHLIEEGVSGYLVLPDDDGTTSAHLDLLLRSPELRFRFGQAARERMSHAFSVNAMVTRMTQVYEEALAEKRPAYLRRRAEWRLS
jgi:glycosyltransferase involved in cell wall biosynthesis